MSKSAPKKKVSPPSRTCTYIITGVNSTNIADVKSHLSNIENRFTSDTIILAGKSAASSDGIISYTDLTETIAAQTQRYVAIVPAKNINLLLALQQSTRGNKPFENGHIYLPNFASDKGSKRSILQRIGLAFTKVFGLVEIDGLDSGIVIITKDDASSKSLLNCKESIMESSGSRFASWAILNGLTQSSITLRQTKSKDINFSHVRACVDSIGTRWNWFITSPIKDLKGFTIRRLNRGNNSIYRLLFAVLCFLSLVMLPYLSFDFGATWDEHEDRKYFTEVISYFQTGGEDSRALDTGRKLHDHLVNYGPFVNLTCAFVEEYISPFDTYETRHLVLSLFAFIGLLFTALLARKAGTWRTAVIVMVIMLLTPTFIGHSANNQKDMPFMAFYIASLFYIVRFTKEVPNVTLKTYVMTGLTMGILFSIRAGGLIVFPYLVMFVGLRYLTNFKKYKGQAGGMFIQYAYKAIIPMAIAYILGVLFWPAALQDPLGHPLTALRNFEKFSLVHVYEVFEGQRYYMKDYPWYYAPKMMYLTLPLFVLAGITAFIAGLIWIKDKYNTNILLITSFAIVFPILYIIAKDSALYNSWRHVLFVLPGVVILAGIGWDWLLSIGKKATKLATAVILVSLMFLSGSWMVKNHPFEYMYYNEIAGGVKGAYGKYELDYWCQTPKAAIKWLLKEEGLASKNARVISNNEVYSLSYYADQNQDNGIELRKILRQIEELEDDLDRLDHYKKEKNISESDYKSESDAIKAEIKPLKDRRNEIRHISILWAREQQWNKDYWDYAIWTNRTLSPTQIADGYFPPKGTIHTIDVDGMPIAAIVKRTNTDIARANELMKSGDLDSAELLLKRYIEYDPKEEEAYRTLAYLNLIRNQWQPAIDYASKALELCPESYFSLNFQGQSYLRSGQTDKAFASFRQAIKYKPNFSQGHMGLGDIAMTRKDPGSAIKHYNDALSFAGNNAYIYFQLGEAYMQQNDLNNAANHYNAAIQTNKNFVQAYQGMYNVLVKAGQPEKAQEYLNSYNQLIGQ